MPGRREYRRSKYKYYDKYNILEPYNRSRLGSVRLLQNIKKKHEKQGNVFSYFFNDGVVVLVNVGFLATYCRLSRNGLKFIELEKPILANKSRALYTFLAMKSYDV